MSEPERKSGTAIEVLGPDGSRTPVEGKGVVAAFGDGRELRVGFSRHPMSEGGVTLQSEFVPPGTEPRPGVIGRIPEVFATMTLHPGGGNFMRVGIEARSAVPGGIHIEAGAAAPKPVLYAMVGEERSALAARVVALSLGNGAELMVGIGRAPQDGQGGPRDMAPAHLVALHAGRLPTPEEVDRMKAGGPVSTATLRVSFGAANVVHVLVRQDGAARALRTVEDVVDLWLMSWTRDGLRERIEESARATGPDILGALVERLSAGEPSVRVGAHELLVLLTGLDLPGPPDAGDAGVLQWTRWWEGAKGRLVFDATTRRFVTG